MFTDDPAVTFNLGHILGVSLNDVEGTSTRETKGYVEDIAILYWEASLLNLLGEGLFDVDDLEMHLSFVREIEY